MAKQRKLIYRVKSKKEVFTDRNIYIVSDGGKISIEIECGSCLALLTVMSNLVECANCESINKYEEVK